MKLQYIKWLDNFVWSFVEVEYYGAIFRCQFWVGSVLGEIWLGNPVEVAPEVETQRALLNVLIEYPVSLSWNFDELVHYRLKVFAFYSNTYLD